MDEISVLAIIKILDENAQSTMMLKLKFTQNLAILDVTSTGLETMKFNLKEAIAILDFRLMDYNKIKQGILQQNVSKYYRFESADTLCEQFNRFINTMKKRKKEDIHG